MQTRSVALVSLLALTIAAAPGAGRAPSVALAGGQEGGACTVTVLNSLITAIAAGGTFTANVTTSDMYGCTWTASTGSPWIHLDPTSGYGNGTLTITVDPYTPSGSAACIPRLGAVSVETAVITVVQGTELIATCITNSFPMPPSEGSDDDDCCATKAANLVSGGATSLELARRYRDEVLARTPGGRELVRQYYAHTGEVVRIMAADPWLGFRAARMLERHTATLRAAVDGGAVIAPSDLDEIDALLGEIEVAAGADLGRALGGFRRDLRSPDVQATCGISVRAGSAEARAARPAGEASAPYVGIAPAPEGAAIVPLRVPDLLAIRARGRAYAHWYRKHAEEAARLFAEDPLLAVRAMGALAELAPVLRTLVDTGSATATGDSLASLDGVLGGLERRASPGFARALGAARRDLGAPRVLAGFGVRTARPGVGARAGGARGGVARGEVQLPRQPARVAGVRQQPRDQHLVGGNGLAVLATARRARVTPRQKTGATRRADRALAVAPLEQRPARREPVEVRRLHKAVARASQRIEPLLIGADPQNVRQLHGFRWPPTSPSDVHRCPRG